MQSRVGSSRTILPLTVVSIVGVCLLAWGTLKVLPMTGQLDKGEPIGPSELADLALGSVQYLQSLTTAVFGGAMLLLSQRVLGRWSRADDSGARAAVACGFVMLMLSLASGFLQFELITEAADQRVLDDKMASLRILRVVRRAERA